MHRSRPTSERTRHNKVRLGEKQKGVKRDGGNGEHDDRREDQSAVEETGVSCGVKRVHLRLAHEENTSPNETFEQLISARADVKQTRNIPSGQLGSRSPCPQAVQSGFDDVLFCSSCSDSCYPIAAPVHQWRLHPLPMLFLGPAPMFQLRSPLQQQRGTDTAHPLPPRPRPRPHRGLHRPVVSSNHDQYIIATHKVTVEEQKVDDVPDDCRRLDALFLSAVDHKVPSKPSGLLDMCQSRVKDRRPVQRDVRERRRATGSWPVIVLPFVNVMSDDQRLVLCLSYGR